MDKLIKFNHNHKRSNRGFSLLELLFALSILSVGLLFAATIFPSGYRRINHGIARERAASIAMQALETAKSIGYDDLESTLNQNGDGLRIYYDVDGDNLGREERGGNERQFAEPFECYRYKIDVDTPVDGITTVSVYVTWVESTTRNEINNDKPYLPSTTDGYDPEVLKAVILVTEDY